MTRGTALGLLAIGLTVAVVNWKLQGLRVLPPAPVIVTTDDPNNGLYSDLDTDAKLIRIDDPSPPRLLAFGPSIVTAPGNPSQQLY